MRILGRPSGMRGGAGGIFAGGHRLGCLGAQLAGFSLERFFGHTSGPGIVHELARRLIRVTRTGLL